MEVESYHLGSLTHFNVPLNLAIARVLQVTAQGGIRWQAGLCSQGSVENKEVKATETDSSRPKHKNESLERQ